MAKEMVTIPLAKYQQLLQDQQWLSCLNAAGVDNWDGIEQAIEIQKEMEAESKTKLAGCNNSRGQHNDN